MGKKSLPGRFRPKPSATPAPSSWEGIGPAYVRIRPKVTDFATELAAFNIITLFEAELNIARSSGVIRKLVEQGDKTVAVAKGLSPKDTGALEESIHAELGSDGLEPYVMVGSDLHYAIFQELGTRHITGRHYLLNALLTAGHL